MSIEKSNIWVPKKRTIFIWDIQWCYDEFVLLIKKLKLWDDDVVYITWDIINKWPKSFEALVYIYENKDKFISVLWNHELNFLNYLDWKSYWKDDSIFKKLEKQISKKPKLLEYLKSLPLYIKNKDFILVHWGRMPWKKLKEHKPDEITRLRDYKWQPWYELYEKDKKIIYWHRAVDWLRIRKNTIWIDTWCVYWKMLTAYVLETWEVIQQQALDIYINVYKEKILNE